MVAQRESELTFAQNTLQRSEDLVARGFVSPQKLDGDRTRMLTAKAALVAARSQVIQARVGHRSGDRGHGAGALGHRGQRC